MKYNISALINLIVSFMLIWVSLVAIGIENIFGLIIVFISIVGIAVSTRLVLAYDNSKYYNDNLSIMRLNNAMKISKIFNFFIIAIAILLTLFIIGFATANW